MKNIKGKTFNIKNNIYGKFSTKNNIFNRNRIVYCEQIPFLKWNAKAFIVNNDETKAHKSVGIVQVDKQTKFNEGDIIKIEPNGSCTVVWENNSPHNAFYVTDICNSKCIMCPQIVEGCSRYDECIELLKYIDLNNHCSIGITGGEPTLEPNKLITLLKQISKKQRYAKIHILTNGRKLNDINFVKKLAALEELDITYGIPIYSNISDEHDNITGINGSFKQTLEGLYNLAKYRQKIEIRIVIMRQNYQKLKEIADFIYRNLPFVVHIAYMGLEYHGNAEINYEKIAIDPSEYQQELYEAIKSCVRYNINADVYNVPLCLADNRIENFCKDSISTWKKTYLDICTECTKKDVCCGVFATSFKQSNFIKPIT